MKKIVSIGLLTGIVFSGNAQQKPQTQDVIVYKVSRTNNSVPANIAGASYDKETRTYYMFYDETVNYHPALPVLQNNVPQDVVNAATKTYGSALYGITRIKGVDNADIYQVRLMENGMTRLVWMNANGTAATDIFKTKTDEIVIGPVTM